MSCHYWNEVFWTGKCGKKGWFWMEIEGLVIIVEEGGQARGFEEVGPKW